MFVRKLRLPLLGFACMVLAAMGLPCNDAWALGFRLGETKEQLELKYEVSVADHGTGRVTVTLTIADEGQLKPLDSVDLVVPSEGRTGVVDLSLSLATTDVDGKRSVRVHLKKEWAERAEIQLKTSKLRGKEQPLTWYYYAIPIAEYLKDAAPKKD